MRDGQDLGTSVRAAGGMLYHQGRADYCRLMRRRIDVPFAQHLEEEGLEFLQFAFRCAMQQMAHILPGLCTCSSSCSFAIASAPS